MLDTLSSRAPLITDVREEKKHEQHRHESTQLTRPALRFLYPKVPAHPPDRLSIDSGPSKGTHTNALT